MQIVDDILEYFIAATMIVTIGYAAFTNARRFKEVKQILHRFRSMILLEMAALVAATVLLSAALWEVPILQWSWLTALFGMASGNMIGLPLELSSQIGSFVGIALTAALVVMLLIALPLLAYQEEALFRPFATSPKRIVITSILFGLSHITMGVPIAVSIALIVPGFYFAWVYRRAFMNVSRTLLEGFRYDESDPIADAHVEAVAIEANFQGILESSMYHTVYNVLAAALTVYALFI